MIFKYRIFETFLILVLVYGLQFIPLTQLCIIIVLKLVKFVLTKKDINIVSSLFIIRSLNVIVLV